MISAVIAIIPAIIVTTIVTTASTLIIVVALVVSASMIIASVMIMPIPSPIVPDRHATTKQEKARNSQNHNYCALHFDVLKAGIG